MPTADTLALLQGPLPPSADLPFILQQAVAELRSTARYLALLGRASGTFYDDRQCRNVCDQIDDAIIASRIGDIAEPKLLIAAIIDMWYAQSAAVCQYSAATRSREPTTIPVAVPRTSNADGIGFVTGLTIGLSTGLFL